MPPLRQRKGHASRSYRPWQCYAPNSGYRFSHIGGTVFENTNKPLRDWFRVLHMMLTSKKGVSALQVYRRSVSARTKPLGTCATGSALASREEFRKLVGVVEIDETYVGGKGRNRHGPHDGTGKAPKPQTKTAVMGAVQRKGNVVARVIPRVDHRTVMHFLNETVSNRVSLVAHDMYQTYTPFPRLAWRRQPRCGRIRFWRDPHQHD